MNSDVNRAYTTGPGAMTKHGIYNPVIAWKCKGGNSMEGLCGV